MPAKSARCWIAMARGGCSARNDWRSLPLLLDKSGVRTSPHFPQRRRVSSKPFDWCDDGRLRMAVSDRFTCLAISVFGVLPFEFNMLIICASISSTCNSCNLLCIISRSRFALLHRFNFLPDMSTDCIIGYLLQQHSKHQFEYRTFDYGVTIY